MQKAYIVYSTESENLKMFVDAFKTLKDIPTPGK